MKWLLIFFCLITLTLFSYMFGQQKNPCDRVHELELKDEDNLTNSERKEFIRVQRSCDSLTLSIAEDGPNPCYDKLLIKLEQKDSLSDIEMQTYIQLRQLCEQHHLNQTVDSGSSTLTAFAIISLLIGAACALYILSLK